MPENTQKRYKIIQIHKVQPYIGTYRDGLTKKQADDIMSILVQTAGQMKYEIREMV